MINPFSRLINESRNKKYLLIVAIILCVVIFTVFVWAAYISLTNPVATQDGSALYSASTTTIVFNVVLRLMLVLALIYLCFGAYKWVQNKKSFSQPQKRLSVLETIRLSPRQSIHIVRVDRQEYLIGATDQTMNLLSEIDGLPQEMEEIGKENPIKSEVGFQQVLNQTIKNSLKAFGGNQNNSLNNSADKSK